MTVLILLVLILLVKKLIYAESITRGMYIPREATSTYIDPEIVKAEKALRKRLG
jgi:hypothetical protein